MTKRQQEKRELEEYRTERRQTKERKVKLKTRSDWLKEVQVVFNAYIRARDKNEGCCSCDKPASWQGQFHASHYRSVGACPELRFEELNVWKACSICNNYLSGNLIEYRIRLSAKIGLDKVEWLEGKHEPKHYTIDELKELKRIYREKIKLLEAT
jgi:hypothetical protein